MKTKSIFLIVYLLVLGFSLQSQNSQSSNQFSKFQVLIEQKYPGTSKLFELKFENKDDGIQIVNGKKNGLSIYAWYHNDTIGQMVYRIGVNNSINVPGIISNTLISKMLTDFKNQVKELNEKDNGFQSFDIVTFRELKLVENKSFFSKEETTVYKVYGMNFVISYDKNGIALTTESTIGEFDSD